MIEPIPDGLVWPTPERKRGYPTAAALIDLWNASYSGKALRFAAWALKRAYKRGCFVLE